jgi:DNA-binding CsgD family transcriptional regulator
VIQLTPFELRLLPLLATSLSLAEIARMLEIPRTNVQSAAESIYRKLRLSGGEAN